MADQTSIEWTDATWTPVKGCTRASEGCRNCYAEIMTARFSKPGMWGEGLAKIVDTPDGKDHRWTGVLRFDEKELLKPLSWKKPRKIFVCSTSDLFHEKVQCEWLDKVFAVMALCPQHTFQVLTKRPERMLAYLTTPGRHTSILFTVTEITGKEVTFSRDLHPWPLPNVWAGTSVEDQERAEERIPILLQVPAAVRWLSMEPMLGPVDLTEWTRCPKWSDDIPMDMTTGLRECCSACDYTGIANTTFDWVVLGGESGPGSRPMHPDWARKVRDECEWACIPFLFKQWGDWAPYNPRAGGDLGGDVRAGRVTVVHPSGRSDVEIFRATGGRNTEPGTRYMRRLGKHDAGRLLAGVMHDGYPA